MVQRRRATNLTEFRALQKQIFAPPKGGASGRKAPEFQVRASDVFIASYAKSGTTWLQQIFHTLRTRGDMDFEDISAVVPWYEVSPLLAIDLNAEQRAQPRGFKSHARWEDLPRRARYIVSVRHPADVAYSSFKFMEGWFIEPGSVSVDDFVRGTFLRDDAYFAHLLSWWARRAEPDVLFMTYETMKSDLDGTIRAVAEFCNMPLDDALLHTTREHASLAFMQQHKDRFDDALLRARSEAKVLPPGSDSAKVRQGDVGERAHISADVLGEIQQQWREKITPEIGFADYDALLAHV